MFLEIFGVLWESWGRNSVGRLWGIAEELPQSFVTLWASFASLTRKRSYHTLYYGILYPERTTAILWKYSVFAGLA